MNSKLNSKKLKASPEISEICGIHAGDGYLRNDGKRRELDISGSCEEKDYYDNHVIPLFNKVFNLSIKGRFFPHRNTYGFVIRDIKIIEFMHNLGFPYGNKSSIIKIPDSILNKLTLVKHFLRGYFDTDGHISCSKKYGRGYTKFKINFHCYPRVTFTTVSPHLADQLKWVLTTLSLPFYLHTYQPLRKTETLKYICEINGSDRTKRFMDLIKPKNKSKTSRYLIWKKLGFCPTNITYEQRKGILKGTINPHTFYKGL